MSFQFITTRQAFLDSKNKWNELAARRPFQSWSWCFHWWDQLENQSKPSIVVELDSQGKWTGLAPMVSCQTRLLASKSYSMGNGPTCTDYVSLVTASDRERDFSTAFAQWLKTRQATGSAEVVEFEGVEINSPKTAQLISQMQNAGYNVNVEFLEGCWRMKLADTWDAVNQGFSKKHRRKTKKAISRLADDKTKTTHADKANFETIWMNFVELHQNRRSMMAQAGCFANPDFERFLKRATRDLIEQDLCELMQISYEGKPIAATLVFHDHVNAYMYQTGFDPQAQKLEPGYLLIVNAIRWAIERQLAGFDFMRGDEPYKARWNTQRIPMTRLRFVAEDSLVSRARNYIWKEYTELRRHAGWIRSHFHTLMASEKAT